VHAQGGGHYRANIGPEWNCPIVPQGGLIVATAARAMAAEVADGSHSLRSISVVFAAPVASGEIEVDVDVLRRGRSMSQCTATVHNPGSTVGTTAIAVFGAPRRGFDFTDVAPPPDVPPPLDCPSFGDPPPPEVDFEWKGEPPPFWENVEGRPALGHPPWEEYDPQSSLRAYWYRFTEPPRSDDGTWDRLAVLAMCDTMPGSVGERVGGSDDSWWAPSADFTAHVFGDARGEWVLGVNRARFAGDGYASAEMEMWDFADGEPHLVAYATQVMFFTFSS
jgi:acyl-CoA thioesterase